MWWFRRVLVFTGLLLAYPFPELFPVSSLVLAAGATFLVLSEIEIWFVKRVDGRAQTAAFLILFRTLYIGLIALAAPDLPAWTYPTFIAIVLIAASGQFGGREFAYLTSLVGVTYVVAAYVPNWSPGARWSSDVFVGRAPLEAWAAALVGLPAASLALHFRQRRAQRILGELTAAMSRLSATQADLGASKEQLERWNSALNEEVERQTSALEERNRYLSIVNAVSFALSEPMDDPSALERATRLVARLMGARSAQAYHLRGGAMGAFHLVVPVDTADVHAPQVPESVLRSVAQSGRPLSSADPDSIEVRAAVGEAFAVVPLIAKGRQLGALALCGTGAEWTDAERHLLLIIGRDLGVALENAGLFRDILATAQRERMVAEIVRMLTEDGPGNHGADAALALLAEQTESAEVAFFTVDRSGRRVSTGAYASHQQHGEVWIRDSGAALVGLVRDRSTALVLGPAGEATLPGRLAGRGAETLVLVPVIARRGANAAVEKAGSQAHRSLAGVLVAVSRTGAGWDQAMSDTFARVAFALARQVEAMELQALQQQRISELAGLAEVARTMQSSADTERLQAGFAQALGTLVPYRNVYIAQLDEAGTLSGVPSFGERGKAHPLRPVEPTDSNHPWFSLRAPLRWAPTDDAPGFVDAPARSGLVIPMRPKGQMLGVVAIDLAGDLDDEQVHIVERAVEQLSLALDSAALYQQATARAQHIQALSNLARIVASVVSLREAFAAFAEEVRWLIPFDRACMLLIDDDQRIVEPYATYPEQETAVQASWLESSIVSVPVEMGGAVSIRRDDPQYAYLDWGVLGDDAVEVAAVPVRQGTRTAAVFVLVNSGVARYRTGDLEALGEVAGLLGVTIERLRLYEQAAHGARHDLLTGLPNYRYLQERLEHNVAGFDRDGESALLVVDMDSLKAFNDTLGHEAGDRVIRIVARELRAACRDRDFVARTGGDEFVVLLEGASIETAERVAERIHAALADAHLEIEGSPTRVAVSIGIAGTPTHGVLPLEVLHSADQAMYGAKFAGGARTSVAEAEREQSVDREPTYVRARSGRLVESIGRALLAGATAEERAAAGLAQHWVIAAGTKIGGRPGLLTQSRMLVPLVCSNRIEAPQRHSDNRLAAHFVGSLQADWEALEDGRFWVRSMIPMAISAAWERKFLGTSLEDLALRVEARADADEGGPTETAWRALAAAIREESGDRREVGALEAA